MATIGQQELDELRDAAAKLQALEHSGVDNWDFYNTAMAEYNQAKEKEEQLLGVLDEIVEVLCMGVDQPAGRDAGFGFTDAALQDAKNIILGLRI